MNTHRDPAQYVSSLDWWLAFLTAFGLLMLVASIPLVLWKGQISAVAGVAVVLILIACILLLVDRVFFTAYILEKEGLHIKGQIRQVFIPYTSILEVKNGSFFDLFSTSSRKRFALSKDCLVLFLQGEHWERISISPKNRQQFLDALLTHLGTDKKKKKFLYEPKKKRRKKFKKT